MIIKKCKGCGAVLQDKDVNSAGFIPVLDEKSTYCKRCFRMKHYNELPKIVASNSDYEMVIDEVLKRKGLIVFIVDIFAFKTTFNLNMVNKLRNHNVILVANKYDLLPKSTKGEKIVDWISKECQKLHFKVDAIGIASAKKGYYMDELMNIIDIARNGKDVYFVGCANVGKSSVINALFRYNTDNKEDVIATSMIPGTTLNEIRIPFFIDNSCLVDTPGLINDVDVLNQLLPISYDKIIPKSELKPVTYQITSNNSIFLGGLANISFESDKAIGITIYASKNLYLHRCKTERVEELFNNQLGKLLIPPTLDEVNKVEYKELNFVIGNKKKTIWFSGFGFVQINHPCKIKIKVIKQTEVYITDAIIGAC